MATGIASNADVDAPAVAGAAPPERLQGLAQLAFGSLTRVDEVTKAQHLALLHAESLELDLSDPLQRQFGDYELLEQVGEGGMGAVYRARHLPLDRVVAVKLLSAGPWASKDFIARFEREAQHAARMQHPNIVTVFEAGNHDGLHFFSMQLVEGSSLSVLLKRGKTFTPKAAASLMRTVAEAVAYAHSLGVLHLDLKPGNVLIDEAGVPHVADFGLARRLDSVAMLANDEVSGTPAYMAPEQARVRSTRLSAATDVWGMGAILYELVTGAPPFRGESAQATLKLVLEGQVRAPRRTHPTLPLDLQAIVLRCLARDPRERYPTARDLADDLARFIEGRPVQARPLNAVQRGARWAKREPKLAATLAAAIAVLVIGLIATSWQWHRAKANALLAQASAATARHTLWKSRSDVAQADMAKGDAWPALANVAANLGDMEAHGDRSDASFERLRIGTVLANAPQLIDAIPLAGQQITELAIAPDGKSVAAITDSYTIHLIDVASGKQRWQVKVTPNSFGMTVQGMSQTGLKVHFSLDGRRIIGHRWSADATAGLNPVLYPHQIDSVLIDVARGKQVAPPPKFADFLAVAYSDDGRYALLFDKHGDVQRWRTLPWVADGDLVHFDGLVAATLDGPQLQGEAMLSDDGATMVLGDTSKLVFRSFDAQHMRPLETLKLTTEQDRATAWAMRHDGRQLALGTMSGQLAVWDPVSGTATWSHSRFDGWIAHVGFSADDTRLLAVSMEPGEMGLFDARNLALVAMPVMLGRALDQGTPVDAAFGPDAATVLTRDAATAAIVWRIPQGGSPLRPPVAAMPPMVANAARFALATDAKSRLLATADNDLLKLWRVRWTPTVGGAASPLVSDTLRFDGKHLVSVDGNRAAVFDVATGRYVGKTIALPGAPTFAGLDGSGTRLIAIAGRELSCWNWRNATPCWPAVELPDSPLRLDMAAHTPMLAVSSGSNEGGRFFEQVRVIDLATGRQRGKPISVAAPLGALRLSDDGRRLLIFEDLDTLSPDGNVLRVVDTTSGKVVQNLLHAGTPTQHIADARFDGDGSIWSLSGATLWGEGPQAQTIWHWDAQGKLLGKRADADTGLYLKPSPGGRGVIEVDSGHFFNSALKIERTVTLPNSKERVGANAFSPDGKLFAIGMIDGVALFDIDRNQRLVPDFKLDLPNDDAVQQLAFSPDGSRLVGRSMGGHWFTWRIAADARSVADIDADLQRRDFTDRGKPSAPLPHALRTALRSADPGQAPDTELPPATNAVPAVPVTDPRFQPLDIDSIANVDPRRRMNRTARVPPNPQGLTTLPHGLQRYDGVDFLLGRAVQLSGSPLNLLNTVFPAKSSPLAIASQRIAAVDALVFQFRSVTGEVGAVRLRYADGSEKVLPILQDRDTRAHLETRATGISTRRIGWVGSYAIGLHGWGMEYSGEEASTVSYVVRLQNPEPNRPVFAISVEAPPTASPGLLFMAVTLEPGKPATAARGSR